ncbi:MULTISPECIES: hypothetical protein [unclassified Ruminococcus]|uniref:hypothetical protein n=1 Tax=unclassified Ruminococcus TaxID=2608920 RepID=UPI00210957A6|nr:MULTISPECIES: hypothetical protein [unclassified Ruminococcus]MCQ4023265.1 hypothetical protein [Ruminococcus sp. zg-924]MCQ4115050.1 hypothetical protein [Ruminococcus sp. zg-921]
MKNSLKTIQVLAQIGRVLSKIAWICCIVGAAGCLIGIASLAVGVDEVFKIGGVTIYGLIKNETGMSVGSMYASMAVGMILCLGEIALALFAERYFKNELKAGTPFTLAGANEMTRLGILAICIPVGTTIVAEIAYQVINAVFLNVERMNIDNFVSVGLGIAFLVMSVVLRYGAQLNADN